MKRNFMMVALLGVTAGASLSANDQNQSPNNQNNVAWQKKTPDEARKEDEASFSSQLSPYTYNYWRNFSPDQKKRATDLADKNRMSPDDAVEKVQMEKKQK